MQLLILVLNKSEVLDELLRTFVKEGINGATIIDSTGMARALTSGGNEDLPIFGSLRFIINEGNPHNKTIFIVLEMTKYSLVSGAYEMWLVILADLM